MCYTQFKLVLLAVVIALAIVLFAPFILLLILVRLFAQTFAIVFRPDLQTIVSGTDAVFATYDRIYPDGSCLIHLVLKKLRQDPFEIQEFRDLFQKQILDQTDTRNYKKLQFYWTHFLGFAFWKEDVNFNIGKHIRDFDYDEMLTFNNWENIDSVVSLLSGQFQNLKWTKNQSPWEMLLLNHRELTDKSLLIIRFHHIIADGASFTKMLQQLFDINCDLPILNSKNFERNKLTQWTAPFKILSEIAKYSLDIGKVGSIEICSSGKDGENVCACSLSFPLELISAIRKKFQVSFSAVINAALLGSTVSALQEMGFEVPEFLNFAFPLQRPNHPEGLANHMYLAQCILPTNIKNRTERLRRIHQIQTDIPFSKLIATDLTTNLAGMLPISMRTWLKSTLNRNVSVSMSNLISPRQKIICQGILLEDLYVFVPGGNYGVVTVIGGANGIIRLGISMCGPGDSKFPLKLAIQFRQELYHLNNFSC